MEIFLEAYFIRYILFDFLVLTEVRLVPGDDDRRVELEEMVVTFLDCPRERAVAQLDSVQVRAKAGGGGNTVLGLCDGHVNRYAGYES